MCISMHVHGCVFVYEHVLMHMPNMQVCVFLQVCVSTSVCLSTSVCVSTSVCIPTHAQACELKHAHKIPSNSVHFLFKN